MSNSGPLNVPTRLPAASLLSAGDRKAAYYLGLVRGTAQRATERLADGDEAAEILGELLARLGRMVDEAERTLDPVARAAGHRLARHRLEDASRSADARTTPGNTAGTRAPKGSTVSLRVDPVAAAPHDRPVGAGAARERPDADGRTNDWAVAQRASSGQRSRADDHRSVRGLARVRLWAAWRMRLSRPLGG